MTGKWKRITAALFAAVMISSTFAACGGGKTTSTTSGATGKSQASDTLIYAQGAEPRGLDPALVDDGESAKVMSNIYEGLLKYSKDGTNIEPALAEKWEISDDKLTYTFNLRKGVKFHDGTDFNADAVKFNIERQIAPKVTEDMGYAGFVYGAVKSVEKVDDYTVKVILNQPSTPFLNNVAMIMAAPMVSPKALQDNNNNVNQTPVGTGPYKFVRWDKDEDVVLVRNDEYWGTKALTKNVIFKFIKDNSARVVALNNGEVDMIDGIDATVIDQITSSGNQIYKAQGMTINYMAYNTTKKPFDDAKVRTAVSQAVNVPELVKSLYKDYAESANSILPSFMPGYDASVKQAAYDPAAAKAALASAGVTKLHMITYSNPRPYNTANGQVLAETIQGYLSKVGITATIDVYDWTTYKDKIKAGDYDVCFYGWTGDNGDPDNFMTLLSDKDPSMNVARWDNADFKALIAKGAATPNGEERNKLYGEMEKMVAEQAIWLPISHSMNLCAYRPNIHDFYYHVTGVTPLAGVSKD